MQADLLQAGLYGTFFLLIALPLAAYHPVAE